MYYSIIYGSIFIVAVGLIILVIFRRKLFADASTPSDKVSDEFFKLLASNVDLSLLDNTLDAMDSERERIGTELHDEMASKLGSLMIDLEIIINNGEELSPETIKMLLAMRTKVKQSVLSIRNIIDDLLPDHLAHQTLNEAIQDLCEKIDSKKGTAVYFSSSGQIVPLNDKQKLYLFRIAQELLNNCFKHSRAWTIYVSMVWKPTQLQIIVRDTGTGMHTVPEFLKRNNKHGITGIYGRSLKIGATSKFSTSSAGTEFDIVLPL